jgi:hypothetical protein
MDYDKLIERLKSAAGGPEGIKMCHDAADALEKLQVELEQAKAERDAAAEAVKNMAEYIVCVGRVDYFLCDDISMEHHLNYQPKNDGNYENAPCYECIADWFLQGNKWEG